jgi:tRNA A-37 threonylcarbamoyl transferase component Bud32
VGSHQGNTSAGDKVTSDREFLTSLPVTNVSIYKSFLTSITRKPIKISLEQWELLFPLLEALNTAHGLTPCKEVEDLHKPFGNLLQALLDIAAAGGETANLHIENKTVDHAKMSLNHEPAMNAGEGLLIHRDKPDFAVEQDDLACSFMEFSYNCCLLLIEVKIRNKIESAVRQVMGQAAMKLKTDGELSRDLSPRQVLCAASDGASLVLILMHSADGKLSYVRGGSGSEDVLRLLPPGTKSARSKYFAQKEAKTFAEMPSGLQALVHILQTGPVVLNSSYTVNDTTISDYSLEGVLGSGGFSTVYTARCKRDGVRVAVKMFKFMSVDKPISGSEIAEEIEILKIINASAIKCEHVCKMVDQSIDFNADRWTNKSYIVFQDIGINLPDFVYNTVNNKAQALAVSARVVTGIKQGLDFLRSVRVVHTDLRPENIIVLKRRKASAFEFQVQIVDFGLAVTFGGPVHDFHGGVAYQHEDLVKNFAIADKTKITKLKAKFVYDTVAINLIGAVIVSSCNANGVLKPPWFNGKTKISLKPLLAKRDKAVLKFTNELKAFNTTGTVLTEEVSILLFPRVYCFDCLRFV